MDAHPIVILGAGPLGLALALALQRHGIASRIIDAKPATAPQHDTRVLALSEGSRHILERIHAWPQGATPIERIHISHQGGFGRTQLSARDYQLPALGYVLPAHALIQSLQHACREAGIAVDHGVRIHHTQAGPEHITLVAQGVTLHTQLLVRAEGSVIGDEGILSRDYQQDAIVCTAQPARPHHGLAFERFTADGPYALLPLASGYSVVVTSPRNQTAQRLALPDGAFLESVQRAFGERVRLTSVGPRNHYPLQLRYRNTVVGERVVWLGNAAQTLHPVAGQGFNLGLRDLMSLTTLLAAHPGHDPGAPGLLHQHAAQRRLDRAGTLGFTDLLIRLFSNRNPLLQLARGLGLVALDLLPPARAHLAQRMMLGARHG
jgi:2-octaprenyl-6-methoxyphenol hydroxylase